LRKLTHTAKVIGKNNDLSRRIELPDIARDEVYELTTTFNRMLSGLEDSSNREKQFSSDVSHELRTPIAVIQAESEYAIKYARTPEEMKEATAEELAACGLGYRVKYILDAIQKVNSGELNLQAIAELPDNLLLEKLQAVMGVGIKVANCIALFAYGRTACVPVDVWIFRAIEKECRGISPFSLYGENAGIIQQYIFYYEREVHRKS